MEVIMKIFFNEKQNVSSNQSFSPSAGKPMELLKHWENEKLPVEIVSSGLVSREDLKLAHASHYVDGVLDLKVPNGFGNRNPETAASLPYTTGSLVDASLYALKTKGVALSPTSGFHHAGHDYGGGFCSFNGLMVASLKLKKEGLVNKVGILDLDNHFGNGTEDIIKELAADFIHHYTFGAHSIRPGNAEAWLKKLPSIVKDFKGCDLVIFQAGADPHINDPLGGNLTTEQMEQRDFIVFSELKKMGIPTVWNLAGGYQNPLQKVLDLHTNTLKMCLKVYSH